MYTAIKWRLEKNHMQIKEVIQNEFGGRRIQHTIGHESCDLKFYNKLGWS